MFNWLKRIFNSYRRTVPFNELLICGEDESCYVNCDNALSFNPVFRAVDLISSSIAVIPLDVFRRTPDGKEKAMNHPAFQLLHYKPNQYYTKDIWLQSCMVDVLLQGNAYSYILRDGTLKPLEILRLEPSNVTPVREDGVQWYVYQDGTEQRKLAARDVVHFRHMGDCLQGYSILKLAAQSLNLGLSAEKYGYLMFQNGSAPQVVLQHPASLTPVARKTLRDEWLNLHQGVSKSHGVAILQEGMTIGKFSFTPEESQLVQRLKHNVKEVANWFGIPAFKLGDDSRTSYNSLEEEQGDFLSCLNRWLVVIEMQLWDKLLNEKEKENYFVEFNRESVVRLDYEKKNAGIIALVNAGLLNRNEARSMLNLNHIPGGETFTVASNIGASNIGENNADESNQMLDSSDK